MILFIGCLFHFSQCISRQIQSKGLSTKYQEDEDFYLDVKRLIALAFVPVVDIVKRFDLIAGEFDDAAEDFIEYFEKVRIGEPKRRDKSRLRIFLSLLTSTKELVEKSPNLSRHFGIYTAEWSAIYFGQITR